MHKHACPQRVCFVSGTTFLYVYCQVRCGSDMSIKVHNLVILLVCVGLVLLLAKLCVFMESTTIPSVMDLLASAFQGKGFRASDEPPPFVGGEVARRLGTASRESLSH